MLERRSGKGDPATLLVGHANGSEHGRVPWHDITRQAPRVLEPGVVGDSARVVVMTRCQAPGRLMAKFSQGHEFIFRRGPDGTRALTKRQLVFVS